MRAHPRLVGYRGPVPPVVGERNQETASTLLARRPLLRLHTHPLAPLDIPGRQRMEGDGGGWRAMQDGDSPSHPPSSSSIPSTSTTSTALDRPRPPSRYAVASDPRT